MSLTLTQPAAVAEEITSFLRSTYEKQGKKRAVIAVSGGVDSALSLTLLSQALGKEQIHPLLMPYGDQEMSEAELMLEFNQIPQQNWQKFNIKVLVDVAAKLAAVPTADKVRRGNLMARARMILIFDQAKKLQALVCGTENKSEKYLGYFTRFGDEASDIEPLAHLYKTQVRQLAHQLQLPEEIIDKDPSAGLWSGQTDEAELGFSYELADQVLFQLIDQQKNPAELTIPGVELAKIRAVLTRVRQTEFKQQTPYLVAED